MQINDDTSVQHPDFGQKPLGIGCSTNLFNDIQITILLLQLLFESSCNYIIIIIHTYCSTMLIFHLRRPPQYPFKMILKYSEKVLKGDQQKQSARGSLRAPPV